MSFDSVQDNAAFARKHDFDFPLLSDPGRRMGMAYGACESVDAAYAKRISYLISPEGKIEKAWADVKAADHPEEVLNEL